MMRINPLYIIPLLIAFQVSCIKKRGCRDEEAMNFDIEAEKHDFTCIYKTWNVIYWDSYYAQNYMLDSGSTEINVFVDDRLIGTKAADTYGYGGVDCDESGELTYYDTLYYENAYQRVVLIDQLSRVVFDKKMLFQQGCNYIEISN